MMKCARAPRTEKRRECRSVAPAIATTAIAYRPTDPKRSVTMLGGEPARGRASMISDRILTCDTTERASIAGRKRPRGSSLGKFFSVRRILSRSPDPEAGDVPIAPASTGTYGNGSTSTDLEGDACMEQVGRAWEPRGADVRSDIADPGRTWIYRFPGRSAVAEARGGPHAPLSS